jgi:hypothetical protein
MKKHLFFVGCLLLIQFGIYAQPKLRVIPTQSPYIPFPSIVTLTSPATTYSFNVQLINTGNVPFNGNIDLLLKAGVAPSTVLLSNLTVNNLNPGVDTNVFSIINFPVDAVHFLTADDIVVIWPRVNAADTFASSSILLDTLVFPIHVNDFTGLETLNASSKSLKGTFDATANSIHILQPANLTAPFHIGIRSISGTLIFETTSFNKDISLPRRFPEGIHECHQRWQA